MYNKNDINDIKTNDFSYFLITVLSYIFDQIQDIELP